MLADGCEAAEAMNINASDIEALETISRIIFSTRRSIRGK